MNIATIKVSGVKAVTNDYPTIPAGIVGATVTFEFTDPAWDGLSKTAVFRGCVTRDVLMTGNVVRIPAETVEREGPRLLVGVYGTDAADNIVIPTVWVNLGSVRSAADPSGDPGTDPSLPVWAQLQDRVEALESVTPSDPDSPGTPGRPGEDGEDGGYYTPAVTQPSSDTVEFAFSPSKPDMPAVNPVQVKLPVGQGSGGNVDLTGVVRSVNGQTPDENGNVKITIPDGGSVELDTTLTQSGKAADAKVVGDKIAEIFGAGTVINQNGGGVLKIWAGTQSEYDALLVKDDDTVYLIDGATSSGGGNAETTTYSITNNLSNVTTSNSAVSIAAGSTYYATLTPNTEHELSEVTVSMNGVDITATAYADSVVNIESVTGNIVITATATAISGGDDSGDSGDDNNDNASTMVYTFTNLKPGKTLDSDGLTVVDGDGVLADELIPIADSAVLILNNGETVSKPVTAYSYDAEQVYLTNRGTSLGFTTIEGDAEYIKIHYGTTNDIVADSVLFIHAMSEHFEEDGSLDGAGDVIAESNMRTTGYLEVTNLKNTYVITSRNKTTKFAWYDENREFIRRVHKLNGVIKETPPENAKYFRVSGGVDSCVGVLPSTGVG